MTSARSKDVRDAFLCALERGQYKLSLVNNAFMMSAWKYEVFDTHYVHIMSPLKSDDPYFDKVCIKVPGKLGQTVPDHYVETFQEYLNRVSDWPYKYIDYYFESSHSHLFYVRRSLQNI